MFALRVLIFMGLIFFLVNGDNSEGDSSIGAPINHPHHHHGHTKYPIRAKRQWYYYGGCPYDYCTNPAMYLVAEPTTPSTSTDMISLIQSINFFFLASYLFLFAILVVALGFFSYTMSMRLRRKVAELNDCMPYEDEASVTEVKQAPPV
ncbi:hypothetical protein QR680_016274 [Steinernema hermaphroditum]|uniref:CX domain-containing protein n=2 Tax=Steinernema hermaphroditum TaxID=289476 RepID=A0AA39HAN6_9BILA|nr:hypothetical protein QR680_016274 [Steinernema hermaphroditum]